MKKKGTRIKLSAMLCCASLAAGYFPTGTIAETESRIEQLQINTYDMWADGDEGADAAEDDFEEYGISLMAETPSAEISQSQIIHTLLSKVGKGYSQSQRYDENYYDCSSLVYRCLKELGISGVPVTTSNWNSRLAGMKEGDKITFSGTNGSVSYILRACNVTEYEHPELFTVPGTIAVLIEPGKSSGHIAVSLGSFARQGSAVNPQDMIDKTKSYVISSLASSYGFSESFFEGKSEICGADKVWMDGKFLGTDIMTTTGLSGVYNSIWRVEAFNPSLGVTVSNCPKGTAGYNVKYVLVPVSDSQQAVPKITSVTASDVTASGFKLNVTFDAAAGVSSIKLPTWTQNNGQDDVVWHTAEVSGNTAQCYISTAKHNNETGKYITHVYLTDNLGRQAAVVPLETEVSGAAAEPVISDAKVSNVTSEGYTITATLNAAAGIDHVEIPTWTEDGGQDDIIYYRPEVNQNSLSFNVKASDHNSESGKYISHIYLYDKQGRKTICGVEAKLPDRVSEKLSIDKVEVSNVTSEGYTVTATFTAPAGVKEVLMPTWTEAGGQDDVTWNKAQIDGNTAVFNVKTSEHNGESGKYMTHIYVYDNTGKYVIAGKETEVPSAAANVSLSIDSIDISEVTSEGYTVTATFTAPEGVKEVLMPTWTEAGGQDDVTWNKAQINGNTAVFNVKTSEHNGESGKYMTHVYVYDNTGKYVIAGKETEVPSAAADEPLSVKSIDISNITSEGYTVTAVFNAPLGVNKVLMPTWTEAGGQDDLKWNNAQINGNTAVFNVRTSEHNGESGKYMTHVYVYDNTGKYVIAGKEIEVPAAEADAPVITAVNVSDISREGYTVTVRFNAAAGVKEVLMPTWTETGGQDDITWYKAQINGDTAVYRISTSEHRGETGKYITHVYVTDNNGKETIVGAYADIK